MLGPLKSGLAWPSGDVTVSLGSVGLFRRGCGLDLPIAVAILTAAGTLPADPATGAPVGRGAAGPGRARIRRPPLRVPDHRATIAAVTGGGTGLTHIPGGQPGQDHRRPVRGTGRRSPQPHGPPAVRDAVAAQRRHPAP
jgi:predicted ATPase with chaperone activity